MGVKVDVHSSRRIDASGLLKNPAAGRSKGLWETRDYKDESEISKQKFNFQLSSFIIHL